MSTTPTSRLLPILLNAVLLVGGHSSFAETIVLPNVTGFALGQENALWSTEFRFTNTSNEAKTVRVVDWLGVSGALQEIIVPPGETKIVSGWELIYGGHRGAPVRPEEDVFGAAICEVDSGLLVQSSIQTYTYTPPGGGNGTGGDISCWSWMGGYEIDDVFSSCNPGTGPVSVHDQGFFLLCLEFSIPWLFASPGFRRQNLVILNPDDRPSTVRISITSADGRVTQTNAMSLAARSFVQINDLFRQPEWAAFMAAIGDQQFKRPAARAKLSADTRVYAVGYVISWENNTVSVSLPR